MVMMFVYFGCGCDERAEESERVRAGWVERQLPLPESGKPRSHTETLTSASETSGIPSAFQFPSADWR